jgi:hypothetical protein
VSEVVENARIPQESRRTVNDGSESKQPCELRTVESSCRLVRRILQNPCRAASMDRQLETKRAVFVTGTREPLVRVCRSAQEGGELLVP